MAPFLETNSTLLSLIALALALIGKGLAEAQRSLGLAYEYGDGVPEDYVQAYAWLNIAATNGEEQAREGKEELAELMTKEQIAEAQDLSPCKPLK